MKDQLKKLSPVEEKAKEFATEYFTQSVSPYRTQFQIEQIWLNGYYKGALDTIEKLKNKTNGNAK